MALKNEIFLIVSLIFLFWLIPVVLLALLSHRYSLLLSSLVLTSGLILLLRHIFYIVLFPGSNKFISRLFQFSLSKDLCSDYLEHLTSLEGLLVSLDQPSLYIDNKSLKSCHQFISQNLSIFKQSKLSENQKKLFESLKTLKLDLKSLKIRDNQDYESTIWAVLKNPGKVKSRKKMRISGDLEKSIFSLLEVKESLENSSYNSIFQVFWFKGILLGDLDNRRTDLFCRFKARREFMKMDDNVMIDTVFIRNELEKGRELVVLYCLPNAGFYEYLFYQSSWIEFYLKSGLSLMIFNYRGYGKSSGIPSIPRLAKDCARLVMNLRTEKGYKKVLIHGESIGGAVATLSAGLSQADFLVSDRTFSSTQMVFSQYINYPLSHLITWLGPCNSDVLTAFQSLQIKKILTYDPFDEMISLKSSLMAGISRISKSRIHENLLNSLKKNLKNIKSIVQPFLTSQEETFNFPESFTSNLKYLALTPADSKAIMKEIYQKFYVLCEKIDSAGFTLAELIKSDLKNVEIWVKNLETWGSRILPSGRIRTCMKSEAIFNIRKFVKDVQRLRNEYFSDCKEIGELLKEIQNLENGMKRVLDGLESVFLENDEKVELLVLSCGHSGTYDKYEELVFRKMLCRVTGFSYFEMPSFD